MKRQSNGMLSSRALLETAFVSYPAHLSCRTIRAWCIAADITSCLSGIRYRRIEWWEGNRSIGLHTEYSAAWSHKEESHAQSERHDKGEFTHG